MTPSSTDGGRDCSAAAPIWQLSEQIRHRVALSCDAQTIAHGACRGWDEFGNDAIAGFCSDILGANVIVR